MAIKESDLRVGQILKYTEVTSFGIRPSATWVVIAYVEGFATLAGYANGGKRFTNRSLTRGYGEFTRFGWTLGEYVGCPKCMAAFKMEDDYLCQECRYG